jgi:hypothetical protein
MGAIESYEFFKKLEKQLNEINSLYNNLKADINRMSAGQIKLQTSKLLHRITKINLDEVNDYVKQATGYGIQDAMRKKGKEVENTIKKVKDFIYSLKEPEKSQEEIETQTEDRTTPLDKKLDYIRDKYAFLQKEMDTTDTATVLRDAKRLENILARLNFEDLPEGDYEEMVNIKNDVSKMIRTLQGVEKSEKYGPYIHTPLVDLISNVFTLGNREKAETKAATLLNFIEDPERINMFEPAMRRIIAKKMTPKEFKTFYKSAISMMRGERKFESFGDYMDRYEQFYLL